MCSREDDPSMTDRHAWKGWYFVGTANLPYALRDARAQAYKNHPETPIEAMMTPTIRHTPQGIRVFVIGR